MAQDASTIYKLMILYMLSRVDFPLTKAQIGDFVMGKEYMNFLTMQKIVGELIDTELIFSKTIRNRTHLELTEAGTETLDFFTTRLSDTIKAEIDRYLEDNSLQLRNEVSVTADYMKNARGEYDVHMCAKEKGVNLVDITLTVPVEDAASTICENWQTRNQDVYRFLIENLF